MRNILNAVPSKKEKLPLSVTHPELALEIIAPDPATLLSGSHKSAQWLCRKNHIYEMAVRNRVKSPGCPICRGKRVLVGFNDLQTTHPEISKMAFDWDATTVSAGSNKLLTWICPQRHTWKAPVYSVALSGTSCPTCAGQQFLSGFNDLQTTHPEIAAEAVGWDPSKFGMSSKKRVTWNCPIGHIYTAAIVNKTFRGDKCTICAGRDVLSGFNDLATTHPDIAKEAEGWDAHTILAGSNKLQWWRCSENHRWRAKPNARTGSAKTGCPTCANSGFDPNDRGYLYFLEHHKWEMFQIGITNNPDQRLGQHKNLGWEAIELRGPMNGHLTQQWETAILRMLKVKGADLSNEKIAGKFDGYSEAWSKSTFEAKSIKELMRLTEEFEGNR